ncbi:MAG: hypothetical protein DRJ40_08985 [Thermoprotei archaeon]|nr:MAG: hypothetical protein DRJ40_08985 [Thermoprotei archaeon]
MRQFLDEIYDGLLQAPAIIKLYRSISEEDSAKYDYVFSRPVVMRYCKRNRTTSLCYRCPLWEICQSRTEAPPPKRVH